MAMTNSERTARTDAKRGMVAKTYKLPQTVVNEIEQLAKMHGIAQSQLIIQAVELFKIAKG